jgi:C1A family cysteine protease
MSNAKYSLNYKFQEHDPRDYIYQTPNNLSLSTNNYLIKITKIYDQGNLGSCVSNAIAGCLNYYNININPARLYIYFNGRAISAGADIIDDTGLTVRDGCKSVAKYSVCSEQIWPYNINIFASIPPLNCYQNTFSFKSFAYNSVAQNLNSIKLCLSANNPILFGIAVYSSFMTYQVAITGTVPNPNLNTEQLQGGHCLLLIGFNDATQRFTFANSWGTNWGANGFGTIPYTYLLNSNLASDFWTLNFSNLSSKPKITNTVVVGNKIYNVNSLMKLRK